MSTAVPALPPRSATVEGTSTTTAAPSNNCPCYTPAALLAHFERTAINSSDGHRHQFTCFDLITNNDQDAELQQQPQPQDSVQVIDIASVDDTVGIIESTPTTLSNESNTFEHSTTTTTTQFICRTCHAWLFLTATRRIRIEPHVDKETFLCPEPDYLCHHYHSQALDSSYECCGCHSSVSVEWQEPVLATTLLAALRTTRKKATSFAEMMQAQEKKPTLVTTFTTLLIYLKDVLSGVKRNINSNNPNFIARIGLDQTSQALMECIGYHLNDEQFFIPPCAETADEKRRLQLIQIELLVSLLALRQELGETTVPISAGEQGIQIKENALQDLIGIVPSLEFAALATTSENDTYINKAYAYFGLTPKASDRLVAWVYEKCMNEPTVLIDEYDAMDNLVKIATHQSHSDTLQTLVVCERSKGRIGNIDVGDAYAYFDITQEAAEDVELLKGLYRIKVADEPTEKNTHQEKLKVIAIAKSSTEILNFLKQEKGITASTSDADVESLMGVPSCMMSQQPRAPAGLNNIGNTCYFNSLLQYYNALIPFREMIIHNEDHIEGEHSESKRIGNIVVDQSDIRRAKKFVELLKELFLNLQHTSEKAISPQYDLAFMALLNEKEEEEEETANNEMKTRTDGNTSTATDGVAAPASPFATAEENLQVDLTPKEALSAERMSDVEETSNTEKDAMMIDTVQNEMQTTEPINNAQPPSAATAVGLQPQVDTYYPAETVPEDLPPSYEESQAGRSAVVVSDEKDKSSLTNSSTDAAPAASSDTIVPELTEKTKKGKPSVDSMLFGRQQDVTECMSNVMFLVEAAMKPLSKTDDGEQIDDIVRQLFYGKARQILTYHDDAANKKVINEMEEDFSHVIVDASEPKDLYDGLDEYYFAQRVENFQGGREAIREVAVKTFPPVFQILVQRVQFDRTTANVYKSNAFIHFDKVIYLDRYADVNFEKLKDKRAEVGRWRAELEKNKMSIAKYTKTQNTKLSVPELLETTRQMLKELSLDEDNSCNSKEDLAKALHILEKEKEFTQQKMISCTQKINDLKESIQHQYDDCRELAYKLHAVFIHQGQANYGHYWIYILDHKEDQWWKYNDSQVTKVQEQEVLHDTTGSTANPYFLVYVDANKLNDLVETVIPKRNV